MEIVRAASFTHAAARRPVGTALQLRAELRALVRRGARGAAEACVEVALAPLVVLKAAAWFCVKCAWRFLLMPESWSGLLPGMRGDYALCVLCALTFNLFGFAARMDLLFVFMPDRFFGTTAYAAIREGYFVLCSMPPDALFRQAPNVNKATAVALLFFMAGRAPWYFVPASILAVDFPAELAVFVLVVREKGSCNPISWISVLATFIFILLLFPVETEAPSGLVVYVASWAFEPREVTWKQALLAVLSAAVYHEHAMNGGKSRWESLWE